MTQPAKKGGGRAAVGTRPGPAKQRGPAGESRPQDGRPDQPFWRKPLDALTSREWEALCDGCGRCCLVKLEDEDTGRIHFTDVACTLFDSGSCRCRDYARRRRKVADCVKLTPENVGSIPWLPPTCAYRLRHEDKDLPDWHPLISGNPDSVHEAGISARARVSAFEEDVALGDLPDFIVSWPGKWPRGAAKAKKSPKAAGGKTPTPPRTR